MPPTCSYPSQHARTHALWYHLIPTCACPDLEASRIRREKRLAEYAAQKATVTPNKIEEARQRRLSAEEAQNAEALRAEPERQLGAC